jgi:hypothetical protein
VKQAIPQGAKSHNRLDLFKTTICQYLSGGANLNNLYCRKKTIIANSISYFKTEIIMYIKRKLFVVPIIAMMAFLGLFFVYSPVHAEDTVPPVSDTPAETQQEAPPADDPAQPPVVENEPADVSAQPESTPESPDEGIEASPTETPTVNAQPEPQAPSTGLATDEQIILGEEIESAVVPQVVVLDESGNSIPLVTSEAAEALAAPDPYFFVGTTKYSFMTDCGTTVNCTASINPLQTAFDAIISNNYTVVGGAVYVEANTLPTAYGSLIIDGAMWGSNPLPVSLSLIGAGAVEKSIGSSVDHFINGNISITGLKSFTLQGFTVNNAVVFTSNTGTLNLIDVIIKNPAGNGLTIANHSGAINLNTVDSSDSAVVGATIDNTTGPAAPVTVKNSAFNRNDVAGLIIISNGVVNLTGVTVNNNNNSGTYGAFIASHGVNINQSIFSNNLGSGLVLDAGLTGSGNAVILNSQFNNNSNYGAMITQHGNVTISATSATGNGNDGINIDTFLNNPFTGNVSILNSIFDNNGKSITNSAGLSVNAKGTITMTDSSAGSNGNASHQINGAYLRNDTGKWAVNVTNSTFKNNRYSGLYVISGGMITVKDIVATGNESSGALLANMSGTAGVSVLNSAGFVNQFNNNSSYGLLISSKGAVIINAVNADYNEFGSGILVENSSGTGAVTIDGVSGTSASHNGENGVYVISSGMITVKNMDAGTNGQYGFNLINSTGTAGVSILSTLSKWVNSLENNGYDGLSIFSKGAVIVQKTRASNNQNNGANIDNTAGTANVTITDSFFSDNGKASFDYATYNGLVVRSRGSISLTNVYAERNGNDDPADLQDIAGNGIRLDNSASTTPKAISLSKVTINENFGFGLEILTSGPVTYTTGTANDNFSPTGNGISVYNIGANSPVTISKVDINNNGLEGLYVTAKGNITLDDVMVAGNKNNGARLDNSSGTGSVTVKSATGREIRDNGRVGLLVTSKGNIVLTNISINNNGNSGALLDNQSGTNGTVTINNTMYTNWQENGDFGFTINTPGAVRINLVDASGNFHLNAHINNNYGTLISPVTITNSSFNNSETSYGLSVLSRGNITLTNTGASGNSGGYGAILNNAVSGGKGTITLGGTSANSRSAFSDNLNEGLQIFSKGAVTLKNIDASNNKGSGAIIDNSMAINPQLVTISSANFDGNSQNVAGYGLRVFSKGAITLTDVSAADNGNPADPSKTFGIVLDNCMKDGGYCLGNGAVKLTNVAGNHNTGDGLIVHSFGVITLAAVSAEQNGENGAAFHNNNTSHPALVDVESKAGITLSLPAGYSSASGLFANNGGYGLVITSNGAISVANVTVASNGTTADATYISNSTTATPMAVTITKSKFNDNPNAAWGIRVFSNGAITFSNNEVSSNSAAGNDYRGAAELDNHTSLSPQNVTVTSSTFNDNSTGDGLLVLTKGNVLLTNVNASNNAYDGISVDARYGIGTVTLNGMRNSFNGNLDNGVEILAKGNVLATNITAEQNSGAGLTIDNCGFNGTVCTGTGTGTITVTNSNLNHNAYNGIWTSSNGAQTLTNVNVLGNGFGAPAPGKTFDGAHLLSVNKDITITNNTFAGNTGSGIWSNTGPLNWLKLIGTSFFGNSAFGSGYPNLYYTGYKSIS